MRSDHSYSIDVGDSMAVCMVGNFAALHNGAVITCDSAVRYDAQTFECFGNVLINQNTTFIYGDRADYRGRQNKAEVYSPLVKVIDGDATLYTFRFTFDTSSKVGEFSNGGVIFNRGHQLEADRGYYFFRYARDLVRGTGPDAGHHLSVDGRLGDLQHRH